MRAAALRLAHPGQFIDHRLLGAAFEGSWLKHSVLHANEGTAADSVELDVTAKAALLRASALRAVAKPVIVRVRNKVATCSTNKVDSDTTKIPASLKALACRMIIREAKGRLEMELTEDERRERDIDERELTAVSLCNLVVDQADVPEAPKVQVTQPGPTINARRRRFGRHQQEGA